MDVNHSSKEFIRTKPGPCQKVLTPWECYGTLRGVQGNAGYAWGKTCLVPYLV